VKVQFGDLPSDAQAMLTRHLRIDFSQCDFKAPRWFSAWARNDAGHIVGIFAIEFPFWFEGKVTILVLDPRCMSRRVLRAIFTAAFTQAKRLTAEVEPDNRRALRQVQRLGFIYEGFRPLGIEGSRDTIVYGMLKEDCRYLPGFDDLKPARRVPVFPGYVYERTH
jgi:ribosomal protein S18 acetylase RimI-like enzyme